MALFTFGDGSSYETDDQSDTVPVVTFEGSQVSGTTYGITGGTVHGDVIINGTTVEIHHND